MITTAIRDLAIWLLSVPIWIYRKAISPLIGPRCRYSPTCSEYALEALRVHGPFVGLWLSVRRLLRCHPFGGHGWDPVPSKDRQVNRDRDPPDA